MARTRTSRGLLQTLGESRDGRARKTLDSPKIIKAFEGSVLSAPGTHGKHGKAKVSFFSYRR